MDTSVLTSLGLTKKAAKIYLAALSVGTASVQVLAEKAGLKRPTVYIHIQELITEGLLEKVPIGKKEYFHPTGPEVLQTRAENSLDTIRELMPDLKSLQNITQGRPSVRILEGRKALEQIYAEIAESNSIRFWSNIETFENDFQDTYIKLSEAIGQRQIRTKEIIADTPAGRRSSKRYALAAGKFYSSRLATKEGIHNDSAIYGNVYVLFRIHLYNLFVIRIEDPTIVSTMKALYDMAWHSAKPLIN